MKKLLTNKYAILGIVECGLGDERGCSKGKESSSQEVQVDRRDQVYMTGRKN